MYYNAFIRSYFSYCFLYWLNNDRSGRLKPITKIDHLIARLSYYGGLRADVYINKYRMCDVWKVYKLQSLSLMHDNSNNKVSLPFLPVLINSEVHSHNTHPSRKFLINSQSTLDKHNFIYNSLLIWNACPLSICNLPKRAFLNLFVRALCCNDHGFVFRCYCIDLLLL